MDAVSVSESVATLTVQVTLDAMAIEVPIEVPITGQSGTASEYSPSPIVSQDLLSLILNPLFKYSTR
jgi:hypothetical protein